MTEISKWPWFFIKASSFPPGIFISERNQIKMSRLSSSRWDLKLLKCCWNEKKNICETIYCCFLSPPKFLPWALRFLRDSSFWNNLKTVKTVISYLRTSYSQSLDMLSIYWTSLKFSFYWKYFQQMNTLVGNWPCKYLPEVTHLYF